ncbi:hypothetical protein EV13_3083 [Prochlorococcus sp. MIT 0702]|nr:hypothetical protein EV13_3083 [Prochlorococcus sp. MIT 0702]
MLLSLFCLRGCKALVLSAPSHHLTKQGSKIELRHEDGGSGAQSLFVR